MQEGASLNKLLTVALEGGEDPVGAVPRFWYWQVSDMARALREIRESAPEADP